MGDDEATPPRRSGEQLAMRRMRNRFRIKNQSPDTQTHQTARTSSSTKLQFLTVTDPQQFKRDRMTRQVRSHVMLGVRNYRKKDATSPSNSASNSNPLASATIELKEPGTSDSGSKSPISALSDYGRPRSDGTKTLGGAADRILHCLAPFYETRSSIVQRAIVESFSPPHDAKAESTFSLSPFSAENRRVLPRYTNNQCESILVVFVRKHRLKFLGPADNPIVSLPQFRDCPIPLPPLMRRCEVTFTVPAVSEWWLPTIAADPGALLSSFLVAAKWDDMLMGNLQDSLQVVAMKREIISIINSGLSNPDPKKQLGDYNIISIIQLVAAEVMSCNEDAVEIHSQGVQEMIRRRGGLQNLGGQGLIASMTAAVMFIFAIMREMPPPLIFLDHFATHIHPVPVDQYVLESPAYCPRADFYTLANAEVCCDATLDLLRKLRIVTDLFINHHKHVAATNISTTHENLSQDQPMSDPWYMPHDDSFTDQNYAKTIYETYDYVFNLPPVTDPIYEAIRLVSLIYIYAIKYQVRFSKAARASAVVMAFASCRDVEPDHQSPTSSSSSTQHSEENVPFALLRIFSETDIYGMWSELAGTMHWFLLIATATTSHVNASFDLGFSNDNEIGHSSISTVIPPEEQDSGEEEDYKQQLWIRKCLVTHVCRVAVRLGFQYPASTVATERRIVEVQQFLK